MKIHFYGCMILLSFILNIIIVSILLKNTKMKSFEKIVLLLYENIGFIYGAKILTYITHFKELNGNFDFLSLGFSSMGAVIGGLLGIILFSIQFKKNVNYVIKYLILPLPLMYSVSKIGCFVAGCCYGIKYDGIGHIVYHESLVAPIDVKLFPVQLLEVIVFLAIFVYLMYRYYKNKEYYISVSIVMILCSIAKFSLDFFRNSHVGKILSINQVLCLIFLFIGLILIYFEKKKLRTI